MSDGEDAAPSTPVHAVKQEAEPVQIMCCSVGPVRLPSYHAGTNLTDT